MTFFKLVSPLWRSQQRMRFQVMSDLHLEVGQQYSSFDVVPHASRLILAGDIGRLADYNAFRNFLASSCEKFEEVYLVLGNHEFFGVSHQEAVRLADKLQREPGMKGRLILMN
jgi:predicted phosphodiesterase